MSRWKAGDRGRAEPARAGPGGIGRRGFLALTGGAGASVLWPGRAVPESGMLTRPIPRSGEPLPAVGLGTWQTFDVGESASERSPLAEVLRRFLDGGGRVIDSSPMYGRAEAVVGDCLAGSRHAATPFLATKVWTNGRSAGEAQMRESMRRLRSERLDLMQIHNLLDWETHLPVLRDWKAKGRFRYIGITHYSLGAFAQMEKLLRSERLDFVQLPYSLATREAEQRLLPAAADTGTAVLVMRPFEEGALFRAVRGKPLPAWAAELGCGAWSQLFLKFILSHPAVTSVIPATARPEHLSENLRAGLGPLPDEAMRRRMVELLR
ncbi:MAG TPA: aldo/keto reductase [Anaeromyxobacteraceae bacterium]|nr:aldo/keto reductase [Anaeromyxobacteraceae bacterium]